ncbi:hypothetical protein STAQ_43600 [Allostella sp. ATCC 35155]|nr:hypothetical protein STAQ_43600 [Stella sp. ATCC 35155]
MSRQRYVFGKGPSRRAVLKAAATTGAMVGLAPWIAREALSSSGSLDLYTWGDYVYPEMVSDFEKKTGIKVKLSTYGTNDEVFNKMRAAGGQGFDIIMPSVTRVPNYLDYELLQPIDEKKVNIAGVIPSMWKASEGLGGVDKGKRYACPFNWGTEALCIDTSKVKLAYGEASYGSLWDPAVKGKVTIRTHSGMLGMGLFLDATGQVASNRMRDTYKDEASMRKVYDQIAKFACDKRAWIARFWNNAQETEAAFKQEGCVLGQTWDGPAMRMRTETKGRITYLAPKEGALTWMDSMAIPKGARNVEQAYAWMNWYYTPEAAAIHIRKSGYNSCAAGADKLAGDAYAANFAAAYPGNAIENLWWYPAEPAWFVAARTEYRDRLMAC